MGKRTKCVSERTRDREKRYLEGLYFFLVVVGEHDAQRVDDNESARGSLVEVQAAALLEQGVVDQVRVPRDADPLAEVVDRLRYDEDR